MTERIRVGNRGKQILHLLFEHGPLLSSTIRTVIEPTMPQRKVRATIQRLRRLGLIRNHHSSLHACAGRFIELSMAKDQKRNLSALLDITEEKLKSVPGNTEALEHWQECAIWAKRLEKAFPEAKVVRDFQLARSADLMSAACLKSTDGECLPDILLVFPKLDGGLEPVYVGIEIERTQKSRKRLAQKLRLLAGGSKLDTVLYICSQQKVAPKLIRTYTASAHRVFIRTEPYSENFLLILEGKNHNPERLLPSNAKGKAIPFNDWVQFLRRNRGINRRSFNPTRGASGGP